MAKRYKTRSSKRNNCAGGPSAPIKGMIKLQLSKMSGAKMVCVTEQKAQSKSQEFSM